MAAYLHLPNVFMEEEASPSKSAAADQHRDDDEEEGGGGSCIEYLNRQGLHELLFRRRKDCGILQRFVEPKVNRGANKQIKCLIESKKTLFLTLPHPHTTIARARATPWSAPSGPPRSASSSAAPTATPCTTRASGCWSGQSRMRGQVSPSHFLLTKKWVARVNLSTRLTTDHRASPPDHLSEATPLRGSLLVGKVERLCWELTEHIAAVTGQRQRIARCVLNFKVDPNDRIYLLWPSSIRLAEAGGPPSDGSGSSGSSGAPKRSDPLNVRPQLHVPRGLRWVGNQSGTTPQ